MESQKMRFGSFVFTDSFHTPEGSFPLRKLQRNQEFFTILLGIQPGTYTPGVRSRTREIIVLTGEGIFQYNEHELAYAPGFSLTIMEGILHGFKSVQLPTLTLQHIYRNE